MLRFNAGSGALQNTRAKSWQAKTGSEFFLIKKPTVGLAFAAIKIYNKDPPRHMAEPVHNSVTAMATGKPLLAHGDQKTRHLAVMQGQLGVMLVQALSTPRGVLNESQNLEITSIRHVLLNTLWLWSD